jgi:hypothetical protein
VDAGAVLGHEAVKKHVVPALEELAQGKSEGASDDAKEFEAFLRAAAIDPRSDIKEVLVCVAKVDADQGAAKFAVIFGGEFRPEAVADAMVKTSTKDKIEIITIDGRKAAKKTSGELLLVGQASDGAVVFATDQSLYEAAMKPTTAYQVTYALPMNVEAAFVVSEQLIQRARGGRAFKGNPFANDIAATTRVSGFVALQGSPRGEVRVSMKSEKDAAELVKGLEGLILPALKKEAGRQRSQAGEIEALNAAKVRAEGKDVVIDAPWSAAGVEQAAQKLAELIREKKRKKGLL